MDLLEQTSPLRLAKVLIVEDHAVVRSGLRKLIEQERDLAICGEAVTVSEAVAMYHESQPDVTIVDLGLGEGKGWEVLRQLRQHSTAARVIAVCNRDMVNPRVALEAGAMGFVSRHEATEQVIDAIRTVLAGRCYPVGNAAGDSARWFG